MSELLADASCEIGTLHTRTAELAIALAAAIEEPGGGAELGAVEALEALLAELARVAGERPRVS